MPFTEKRPRNAAKRYKHSKLLNRLSPQKRLVQQPVAAATEQNVGVTRRCKIVHVSKPGQNPQKLWERGLRDEAAEKAEKERVEKRLREIEEKARVEEEESKKTAATSHDFKYFMDNATWGGERD